MRESWAWLALIGLVILVVSATSQGCAGATPKKIAVGGLNAAGIALREVHWSEVSNCIDDNPEDLGRGCEETVNGKWAPIWAAYDLTGDVVDNPEKYVAQYCALVKLAPMKLPGAEACP